MQTAFILIFISTSKTFLCTRDTAFASLIYFRCNLVDFMTFLQMKTDIEEERHFYYCLTPPTHTHTLKMHPLDLLITIEKFAAFYYRVLK